MSNKLRVAVVSTSYPLPGRSYNGIFIERLVKNLPNDIEAWVIVPAGNVADVAADEMASGRLISCRYAPRSLQRLARQPGGIPVALKKNKWLYLLVPGLMFSMFIACMLLARQIDIYHANWSVVGVIVGIVGYITKTPVVTTLRGEDVNHAKKSRLYAWLLKVSLALSDKVVVVSAALESAIKSRYPAFVDKVEMIPNGVDKQLLNINRPVKNVTEGVVQLLTVGALIKRKGFDTIILALASFDTETRPKLTIVGDGPEYSNLKKLAETRGVASSVSFAGFVAPDSVSEYLEKSDLFILASVSEGRPNVILEAMAAGLPIIASRIEGVIELVDDGVTGLFFEPESPAELAQKISILVNNAGHMRSMGMAARNYMIEHELLWPNTGLHYMRMYQYILEQSG